MRFKYGQEVRITEDGFFKYSFGVVIDCRINEYISMTTDRNELEYLVKLKHNEKWILECNLDEILECNLDEILEKVDFYKRNASIHQTPPETWAELEDWILSFIKKEANDETK